MPRRIRARDDARLLRERLLELERQRAPGVRELARRRLRALLERHPDREIFLHLLHLTEG